MNDFLTFLVIDELSSTPKYQQLVNATIEAIRMGMLKIGDSLPSINELSYNHNISRITVEKGYNKLRDLGILDAYSGKGYFVKTTDIGLDLKILLIFNKLSVHKKVIYDSFVKELEDRASIDFYIYNNDSKLFCKFLETKQNNHTHIVIIPYFNDGNQIAYQAIDKIPKSKLILVDKDIPEISGQYSVVYENFSQDIHDALYQLIPSLQKFSTLKLIFPNGSYFPEEIKDVLTPNYLDTFVETFV